MLISEENVDHKDYYEEEGDFGDMPSMDELLGDIDKLAEGEVVPGTIVRIDKRDVLVDIGYKSEGILPISEFKEEDTLEVGAAVDVFLESMEDSDGHVVISKLKADKLKSWDKTISAFDEGSIVEGRISRKIKGGLIVDVGMDAFLPASQIDVRPVHNVDDFVGKTFTFKIVKINLKRKNVVVSRRELLEEERQKGRDSFLSQVQKGDLRKGTAKNITDFGVFIDLGGLDGLLHITDMSWGRINHPSQMISVGDEVEVMILDIDKDNGRVSLGLKQKTENPWAHIMDKYPVGARVEGKVVNLTNYGAFVELEEGVEGLLHISEMSWTKRINHPSELLSVGSAVETVVLSINADDQKISLGLKQIQEDPWNSVTEQFKEGMTIKGRVRNITDYGAFVEIAEGIDGLIHISDMSWMRRVNHPSEMLSKGQEIEAVVLKVDSENKKIALGLKQLAGDPWEKVIPNLREGDEINGKVSKITKFGMFVVFDSDLEALVHNSEIDLEDGQKLEDVYSEGQDLTAYISRVDFEQRKIYLSLKNNAVSA